MPELPDLQVFRKNLEKKLAGEKLAQIKVNNANNVNVPVSTLETELVGKKLKTITREGKELFFNFEEERTLSFHLMLNGKFSFFQNSISNKNSILELLFEDMTGLALTDWDGLARVKFNPEIPGEPDALSKDFNEEYLKKGLSRRKRKRIKDLLISQDFVRGIGNAYADEILWEAKIHPESKSGNIPGEIVKNLYSAINKTLTEAEEEIIKSAPDIISGERRDFLKVHNPKRKTSPTGGIIKKKNVGNRITYYTDEQVLYN